VRARTVRRRCWQAPERELRVRGRSFRERQAQYTERLPLVNWIPVRTTVPGNRCTANIYAIISRRGRRRGRERARAHAAKRAPGRSESGARAKARAPGIEWRG